VVAFKAEPHGEMKRMQPASRTSSWADRFRLFGPVLSFDMVRQARRARFIVVRFAYCLVLVVLLLFMIATKEARRGEVHDQAAAIAQDFVELFLVVQFCTIAVLTPAYVAGSIAHERDRKTLEFILATNLLDREIILSKLGSRLANLGMFLLAGLPVLCCLQFLGGVDPNLVLAGFAIAGLTAFGEAGVSILSSVVSRTASQAIIRTYVLGLAYHSIAICSSMVFALGAVRALVANQAPSLSAVVSIINAGNVISVFGEIRRAAANGTLAIDLPVLVGDYAIFHCTLALGCISLAIFRLRRDGLADVRALPKVAPQRLMCLSRSRVYANALLWKELACQPYMRTWLAQIRLAMLCLAVTVFSIAVIVYAQGTASTRLTTWLGLADEMNLWARVSNVAVGMITLLAVAIQGSTSITGERDRQTWDSLVSTPITATEIVDAKWWGSLWAVRWGILWLFFVWTIAVITGAMHPIAVVVAAGTWAAYACFFAALGVWFSATSKSSTRSITLTVLWSVGLAGGHWVILPCCALLGIPERLLIGIAALEAFFLTPPIHLGVAPFSSNQLAGLPVSLDWLIGLCWFMVTPGLWAHAGRMLLGSTADRLKRAIQEDGAVARRRRRARAGLDTTCGQPTKHLLVQPSALHMPSQKRGADVAGLSEAEFLDSVGRLGVTQSQFGNDENIAEPDE
jgi:ABC-type transport system involved in multi-copper enzyme maturation permease subunit